MIKKLAERSKVFKDNMGSPPCVLLMVLTCYPGRGMRFHFSNWLIWPSNVLKKETCVLSLDIARDTLFPSSMPRL